MKIKKLVSEVKLPKTNIYYEKDSIDGYSYLAIARELLGLGTEYLEKIISNKSYGLCSKYNIQGTPLPSNTIYTYSCYSVFDYYYIIENIDKMSEIISLIEKKIGIYADTGLIRYCNIETNYRVPNVTPLAGLMLLKYGGRDDKVFQLLESFERQQEKNGNWRYYLKGNPMRMEDSMHLAMIIYALREIYKITHFDCVERMINKALPCLYSMNTPNIQHGSIGWNPPFLALALRNRKKYNDMFKESLLRTINSSIKNTNFRVRAISAWALSKIYVEKHTSSNVNKTS